MLFYVRVLVTADTRTTHGRNTSASAHAKIYFARKIKTPSVFETRLRASKKSSGEASRIKHATLR